MNKFSVSLCLLATVFAAMIATPALARDKKKPAGPPPRPTVISSVSADSITIAEGTVVMKTFAITQFTEINVKGQRAKLSDLQPGMSVSVTLGTDPSKLSRINAGDAPVERAPKK